MAPLVVNLHLGVVIEVKRQGVLYAVSLSNGHILHGHLGKLHRASAVLTKGQLVNLSMSSFDLSKARIELKKERK